MMIMIRLNIESKNNGRICKPWLHLWLVQHVTVSNELNWPSRGTVHCPFDVEQPRRTIRFVLLIRLCII